PVQVTILTRRSSLPITTTLQPVQTKIFQVEDFQSLTFTKQEGPASVVSLFIQKTFCICCNDNNDSCNEYYHECNYSMDGILNFIQGIERNG
ncbi:hypothetical protein ACT4UL_22575, partial [Bacillus sp. HC-TM]